MNLILKLCACFFLNPVLTYARCETLVTCQALVNCEVESIRLVIVDISRRPETERHRPLATKPH